MLLLLGFARMCKVPLGLTLACVAALTAAFGLRLGAEQEQTTDLAAIVEKEGNRGELRGRIASAVEVDGDLASFRLQGSSFRPSGVEESVATRDSFIVRIKLGERQDQNSAASWKRGALVRLVGTLELPGEAGNFGAFDYRDYLRKQGVFWQFAAKGMESVHYEEKPAPLWMKPLRMLDDLRNSIGRLADRLYPRGDSGYMKGLVVGIRSDLDPVQFDNFARLGLTHVLAISGLHVGVVVYMLLQLAGWLRMTRERSLELTIAMMPVYMMVTGASPSAVRACLMAMIALWLARRHALKDGLHLLCAAAVAMLVWNPLLIEDVSFQLSFLVTAGLILLVPTFTELIPLRSNGLKGAIAVTLTAQLASFPVSVYYFHSMHLLSLPANFVLVPFISFVVMPLGMASLLLGALWNPLGVIPAKLASWGNDLTFGAVDWLNGFIGLRTIWPQPVLAWTASAYILLAFAVIGIKRSLSRRREREWWSRQAEAYAANFPDEPVTEPLAAMERERVGPARLPSLLRRGLFGLACTAWLVWGYQPAWLDRSASVSFLNVGQGDSILIRTGQGRHILIDAGGTIGFRKPGEEWKERGDPYEVGRKLLVPLLLQRGVRELDALVLTHMDADHIGGAKAVMDNVPVRAVLFNGTTKKSSQVLALLSEVLQRQIPAYAVQESMVWRPDRSTVLSVLHPAQPFEGGLSIPNREDQNDRSVVLLLSVYGRNFLLPGDLEEEGEREIVELEHEKGDANRGSIDVLKAGHHGSKTSTSGLWVGYWRPRETVISVGANNFYGHPNAGVIERLQEADSQVWRTDIHGEVQFRIRPDGALERRSLRTE